VGEGLEVGGKLAVGIVAAAIEDALLFAQSLYHLAAALRTVNANLNLIWLGEFTLRIAAAGEELAVTPRLDSQGPSTNSSASFTLSITSEAS